VARDRKRAKQRRERQARAAGPQARSAEHAQHEHEPPELASGEVDLADAQLALGRPELVDESTSVPDVDDDPAELPALADEADFEQLEDDVDATEADFEAGRNGHDGEAAIAAPQPRAARREQRREEGNRFTTFLRGSWRELERVQWPDRQQVGQATTVVIGFVIIAGAFLGLMDFLAARIVDLLV
jgi:preprotein translocase subunit SecE